MATQAELERRARTDTSAKTFAQDVKDRLAAGKSEREAFAEASSGREQTIDPSTGAPLFGAVRSGSSGRPTRSPEEEAARIQRQLLEAQKSARIAGLRGAREGSLAALGRQRETVEPAFLGQRTGLRTQAAQAGRQTAEQLAAKGLTRSGAATQSDIARNVLLQQGLTESGQQEAGVLAGIAGAEADVERQFETGIAQAEADAETAAIQQQLAQIQAERQADIRAGELQSEREFELQKQENAALIDERLARIDLELDEALAANDLTRSLELEREKNSLREDLERVKASLRPAKIGGDGGLTFTQERQLFNDQVKGAVSGANAVVSRLPEGSTRADIESAQIAHLRRLREQGVSDEVLEQVANSLGLGQARFQTTPEQIISGGVTLPTFGR